MKLITLEKWAEAHLDPVPSPATLRMWARTNRFDPPAQKVGRCYRQEARQLWRVLSPKYASSLLRQGTSRI